MTLRREFSSVSPTRRILAANRLQTQHQRIVGASIDDRAVPGHWEGDLIAGSGNTHIATLVERQSRFTMLVKVDGKDTKTVVAALSRQVRKLPAQPRQSLTWGRGMELANHKDSRWPLICRCTFAIRRALGNEAPMRTLIACYDNTSQRRPTFPFTLKLI